MDYCKSAPPGVGEEGDIIALYKPLANLPKKYDHIPLPSALLGVELQLLQSLPVAQVLHPIYLGGKITGN